MKKSTWILIGVIAVIAIWAVSGYNGLVNKDEKVSETFSQLDNTYKRRADLIPNLVETVKKYTDYEGSVLKEVTEARASAQNVTLDLNSATPEQIAALNKAGVKLYFLACGDADFLFEGSKTLDKTLTEQGLKHTFFVSDGGHTWANWRLYLNTFAPLLFK